MKRTLIITLLALTLTAYGDHVPSAVARIRMQANVRGVDAKMLIEAYRADGCRAVVVTRLQLGNAYNVACVEVAEIEVEAGKYD